MNNEPIRVLSIDWDYFPDISEYDRITKFPDGNTEELCKVNSIIWATRYGSSPELLDLDVIDKDFSSLADYLKSLNRTNRKPEDKDKPLPRIMITDSHKWILDCIMLLEADLSYRRFGNLNRPVQLINIDQHTDSYGLNRGNYMEDSSKLNHTTIDCGNWLNYLSKILNDGDMVEQSQFTWVTNSEYDFINLNDGKIPHKKVLMSESKLSMGELIEIEFDGKTPDIIYLCKSACWSPPHLDEKFNELAEVLIKSNIGNTKHDDVIESRFTYEYSQGVKSYIKQYEELRKNGPWKTFNEQMNSKG